MWSRPLPDTATLAVKFEAFVAKSRVVCFVGLFPSRRKGPWRRRKLFSVTMFENVTSSDSEPRTTKISSFLETFWLHSDWIGPNKRSCDKRLATNYICYRWCCFESLETSTVWVRGVGWMASILIPELLKKEQIERCLFGIETCRRVSNGGWNKLCTRNCFKSLSRGHKQAQHHWWIL